VKVMKRKLQGSSLAGSLLTPLAWSRVYVEFAKVRYFNQSRLIYIEVCQEVN
jgi:hypothetical protein